MAQCLAGNLDPGTQSELREDVRDVALDGASGQVQFGRDFRVRPAVADEVSDRELGTGQCFPAGGRPAATSAVRTFWGRYAWPRSSTVR